jgi:dynein heavy chain
MRADVEERVQLVMNLAYEYTMRFEQYAYLWEDDRQDYLNQFLKYGHQLTAEEIESKNLGEEPIATPAVLDQFKEAVMNNDVYKISTYTINECINVFILK